MNKQSTKHLGAFDPLSAKQDALTTAQLAAVNSGINSTKVAQIETNKEDIAAIDDELHGWQKPADWVDLRAGALPNSFYFLVGHSADYTSYNEFIINAEVSNSGTYDVFVDGIKKASAVASGTATTLNWQTLALTSGFDVTYPSALRTHIVRIAPTSSSNSLSLITSGAATAQDQGVLWVHSTCSQAITIASMLFGSGYKHPLCEAFTTSQETFKTPWCEYALAYTNLKTAPVIELTGSGSIFSMYEGTKLKKAVFKNAQNFGIGFMNSIYAQELQVIGGYIKASYSLFYNLANLKKIQACISFASSSDCDRMFYKTPNVQTPLFLDASDGTGVTRLTLGGSSTEKVEYVKGLVVSSSAPFSNANTPQLSVAYSGMTRAALVTLFNSLPPVTDDQVCDVTGATGAADLDATDLAIATAKGWTVTR